MMIIGTVSKKHGYEVVVVDQNVLKKRKYAIVKKMKGEGTLALPLLVNLTKVLKKYKKVKRKI